MFTDKCNEKQAVSLSVFQSSCALWKSNCFVCFKRWKKSEHQNNFNWMATCQSTF